MKKLVLCVSAFSFCVALSSYAAGLLPDSGFEGTTLTNNWYVFDGAYSELIDTSTDYADEGSQALKIASTGSVSRTRYDVVNIPLIEVVPGTEYGFEAQYYCPEALLDNESFAVGLFWYKLNVSDEWVACNDSGGWTIVYGPYVAGGFDDGEETTEAWTSLTGTQTAPLDAQYLQVAIQLQGRGSTVYFDDIDVIPEPMSFSIIVLAFGGLFASRRLFLRAAKQNV